MKVYYQCRLTRGTEETTGWLEARAAKQDALVKLVGDDYPWRVARVGDHAMPENLLKEQQMLNRNSLPSIEAMR